MEEWFTCYKHKWEWFAECPKCLSEGKAYEGPTEYLNSKIAKLEQEIEKVRWMVLNLKETLTRSTPQEPRKRGRPSKEALERNRPAVEAAMKRIFKKGKNEQ